MSRNLEEVSSNKESCLQSDRQQNHHHLLHLKRKGNNVHHLCKLFESSEVDSSQELIKSPIRPPRQQKLASSRPLPRAAPTSRLYSKTARPNGIISQQTKCETLLHASSSSPSSSPSSPSPSPVGTVRKKKAEDVKDDVKKEEPSSSPEFQKLADLTKYDAGTRADVTSKPPLPRLREREESNYDFNKVKANKPNNSKFSSCELTSPEAACLYSKPVLKALRVASPALKRQEILRKNVKPPVKTKSYALKSESKEPPGSVAVPVVVSSPRGIVRDRTRMFQAREEDLGKAPIKPPRTFAHDIYVKEKAALKKPQIPSEFRENLVPSNEAKSNEIKRRRSKSLEHIYAEPLPLRKDVIVRERVKTMPDVEPYCVTPLFSTPQPLPQKPLAVRDIIKNSFAVIRKLTKQKSSDHIDALEGSDTGSDVSLKDVKERLIYVQTLKKSFNKSATHYYSTGDMANEMTVCKCCLLLSDQGEKMTTIPNNIEVKNFEFVAELISSAKEIDDQFYWFTICTKGDQYLYAYCCRQAEKCRTICLLSDIYFPELFDRIFRVFFKPETDVNIELVNYLRGKCCALPGEMLYYGDHEVTIPYDCQITACKPSNLLNLLSTEVLLKAVSSLIHERRVALVSKSVTTLFDSCKSLVSFIYPLAWDYVYLPRVPKELLSLYAAMNSMPYLIGISSNDLPLFMNTLRKREEKILVIDLDFNEVIADFGDECKIIPAKIQKAVTTALDLSRNMTDPSENLRDLVISEAFMQMFVELIGSSKCFLVDGHFKKNVFINSTRNKSVQMFLHWFCETRLFEAFTKYCQLRKLQQQIQPLFNQQQRMGVFERKTQICNEGTPSSVSKCKTDEGNVHRKVAMFKSRFLNGL